MKNITLTLLILTLTLTLTFYGCESDDSSPEVAPVRQMSADDYNAQTGAGAGADNAQTDADSTQTDTDSAQTDAGAGTDNAQTGANANTDANTDAKTKTGTGTGAGADNAQTGANTDADTDTDNAQTGANANTDANTDAKTKTGTGTGTDAQTGTGGPKTGSEKLAPYPPSAAQQPVFNAESNSAGGGAVIHYDILSAINGTFDELSEHLNSQSEIVAGRSYLKCGRVTYIYTQYKFTDRGNLRPAVCGLENTEPCICVIQKLTRKRKLWGDPSYVLEFHSGSGVRKTCQDTYLDLAQKRGCSKFDDANHGQIKYGNQEIDFGPLDR